jgi:hypothetical protein
MQEVTLLNLKREFGNYVGLFLYTQTHIKWSLVFFLSSDPEVT